MRAGRKSFATGGLPIWWVRPAYSSICEVDSAESSTNEIWFTHLMQVQPYQPGTTRRTGPPCSRERGGESICVARTAWELKRSASLKMQHAPGAEVMELAAKRL